MFPVFNLKHSLNSLQLCFTGPSWIQLINQIRQKTQEIENTIRKFGIDSVCDLFSLEASQKERKAHVMSFKW